MPCVLRDAERSDPGCRVLPRRHWTESRGPHTLNSPATFVDRNGRQVSQAAVQAAELLPVLTYTFRSVVAPLAAVCLASPGWLIACTAVAVALVLVGQLVMSAVAGVLSCSSTPGCLDRLLVDWGLVKAYGSVGLASLASFWGIAKLREAAKAHPEPPRAENPCSQPIEGPSPDRLLHIQKHHMEGSPLSDGKSYFYRWVNLWALWKYAQLARAQPDGWGKCVRHAIFPVAIGVDRDTDSPTHLYAVVTTVVLGKVFNMYPGLAAAWSD
jgi:hypothetical protein